MFCKKASYNSRHLVYTLGLCLRIARGPFSTYPLCGPSLSYSWLGPGIRHLVKGAQNRDVHSWLRAAVLKDQRERISKMILSSGEARA